MHHSEAPSLSTQCCCQQQKHTDTMALKVAICLLLVALMTRPWTVESNSTTMWPTTANSSATSPVPCGVLWAFGPLTVALTSTALQHGALL
ncbi:hypothetical protein COCON_G00076560 [Conger conger]|uniref:Uncharacterized protein n=1 Tax=Conger conger TaxID=82655 RepID=A0A9Q1DNU8_CONCO|nr:hypothetical protein COCON_G00076560 [Conger conger]